MNKVNLSVVVISCGRKKYLKKTIDSFLKFNTYPINKLAIIEDGNNAETISYIKNIKIFDKVIINKNNLGQSGSLNMIYKNLEAEYVLHLEDDWEFNKNGNFIDQCIDILKSFQYIKQVSLIECPTNTINSHYYSISKIIKSKNGYIAKVLDNMKNYKLHGFTFNPNIIKYKDLMRLYPFSKKQTEITAGRKFYELGFFSATLNSGYCKHIGIKSAFKIQKSIR